jgi:hypothetical protein
MGPFTKRVWFLGRHVLPRSLVRELEELLAPRGKLLDPVHRELGGAQRDDMSSYTAEWVAFRNGAAVDRSKSLKQLKLRHLPGTVVLRWIP